MSGPVYLLGPQRPEPNMPAALSTVQGSPGSHRIVYITAGWRHDESDDEALRHDVGVEGCALPLYAWFEELAATAPALFAAHHAQQDEIRRLKSIYRIRLDPALDAVRQLLAHQEDQSDAEPLREELADALAALSGLRERFVRHCDTIRERFTARWAPLEHPHVRERVEEIREMLADTRAVLIAGGHAGVLRNRLEFFGLGPLLAERVEQGMGVMAWSAGAMALTDNVVLFHDDPPTGKSNAEVLDRGLGLAPGIVALPHARQRLWLHDPARVSVMAQRFAPVPCIGLENGAWLVRRDRKWINLGNPDSAVLLRRDGHTSMVEVGDA